MTHTILIIEDNQNIRRFISTALTLEGYRVLEASTLQDGMTLATREQPNLILLDLALPDGTGWEFLQAIRAQPEMNFIQVAILTASADQGMADRGLAAGAVAFITKPISASDLIAFVRKTLGANQTTPTRSK
jgi:two-component system KDP operon response regulator KdpE